MVVVAAAVAVEASAVTGAGMDAVGYGRVGGRGGRVMGWGICYEDVWHEHVMVDSTKRTTRT